MAKTVMGSTKSPRIKRGSRSYHVKPGETFDRETGKYTKEPTATDKSSVGRRAKEDRQRVRGKYRKGVVTTKRLGRETANRLVRSFTGENKPKLGGGGRAKAAATRARNIAKSKKAGTYVRSTTAQTARNRAAARSDARTRVGGGSPGSRVAGGLARVKGR